MSFRGRHDVYDDTPYGPHMDRGDNRPHRSSSRRNRRRREPRNSQEEAYNRSLYYPQPGDYSVVERSYPPPQASNPQPPSMLDSFFGPMSDMQPYGGRGGLFDDGLFGMMRGMMSSVDRMFDEMAASELDPNYRGGGSSSGTFFYESKTRTVGPDGIVREETVRTTPGADGRPETRRTVRESDGVSGVGRYAADPYVTHGDQGPMPRVMNDGYDRAQAVTEPDVVIEELDEYGNVIASNDAPLDSNYIENNAPYDERERGPNNQNDDPRQSRSWWQRRYRQN